MATGALMRNPLWSTFDTFQFDLPSSGARVAIGRLAASLAHHRSEMAPEVWKASCAELDRHPAVRQLLEDPCLRDARKKPAGYAGDARTLDYLYLQDPGPQPLTPTGRALFDASTTLPIAAAVRHRCAALAGDIAARARREEISVASIACGHARELDRIPQDIRKRIRFWGLDHDPKSVEHCRSQHDASRTAFELGSVRDVIAGSIQIPRSDLVYASGLFDYLNQFVASALLRQMVAALKVGGSVIVPNLTPDNDEIGYMEAVTDWWMCYRTEADLLTLAELADADQSNLETTTFLESDNRIAWLRIDRLAPAASESR
jgi:extracellular factor (EF) 3-hydroxypalmitic acid methyl ester biosynthesis protein